MVEKRVRQPGLFVASRPLLTFILTLGAIGLVGFSGGILMEDAARLKLTAQLWAFLKISALAAAALIVPVIAPGAAWGRGLLALGFFLIGLLIFGTSGDVLGGKISAFLIATVVVCLLVLISPFTRRLIPIYAGVAPFCGFAGLAGLSGFLIRHEYPSDPALLTMQILGLCTAIMTGVFFVANAARHTSVGFSTQAAAAHALNKMMRDVFFLGFAAALIFQFYVRDDIAGLEFSSLLWSGFAAAIMCALPTVLIGAAIMAVLPGEQALGRSRLQADGSARMFFRQILKRLSPAIYLAGLLVTMILVSILFPEVPLAVFTVIEQGGGVVGSLLVRVLFFLAVFVLTALLYASMRMAACVVVVFFLGDVLTAIFLSQQLVTAGGVMRLVDVAPRLIVLYFIVQVVLSWRLGIEAGVKIRSDGIDAAMTSFGPGVLAVLICLVVFTASSFLLPGQQVLVDYAALRLLVQMSLTVLILPMAMGVLSRFRVSI